MGHGIAQVAAVMGAEVRIYDALQGAPSAASTKIAKNLDKGVELGKVTRRGSRCRARAHRARSRAHAGVRRHATA